MSILSILNTEKSYEIWIQNDFTLFNNLQLITIDKVEKQESAIKKNGTTYFNYEFGFKIYSNWEIEKRNLNTKKS